VREASNLAVLLPQFQIAIARLSLSLIVWFSVLAINALLNAINDIYLTMPRSEHKPIKGYLQLIAIFFFVIAIISIIGIIIGKSPVLIITSLGAMTAIILLIFKDTILSLIASFQITYNDLIKIGDWISVPEYHADGDVIDIALHTVKVQNWDKTITTIPTHKLVENSFKNWRGMTMSGGRRIKRSVYIDMNTIKICDDKMIEKYEKIFLLKDYIAQKKKEIEEYNKKFNFDTSIAVNGRRMTNIGTFRAYIGNYLKQNPHINKKLTFLIRQLPSGPTGLPLEIYVFTSTTEWVAYESIQSDIFDHILAIVPEFDLKIFQYPSGNDFRGIFEKH
jgi:miniconductance mechanosensitive channel